jgi:hypothetical protein
MLRRTAVCLALVASLTACTTLYSSPATIGQDNDAVVFTAHKRLMFTGRSIYIYANDREIMKGKARYWSKRITLTGNWNGKPVSAECGGSDEAQSSCLVRVSGALAATLIF